MDQPPAAVGGDGNTEPLPASTRRGSSSQHSENSQTAADVLRDQMQLEADAREALPYSIENCTKELGPLRQNVFSCLTCNPPPTDPTNPYNPAGICYACSVQCHGEHQLVEIFSKRNFTCDCGTTRLPSTSPCALRLNPSTNSRGGVHSEEPNQGNKYNQNFRNRFCACECDYDPFQQKGTMFQCLGLGTHETGGCGEDWYHPGCVVGLGQDWLEKLGGKKVQKAAKTENGALPSITEDEETAVPHGDHTTAAGDEAGAEDGDDEPTPPGFPNEDDFEVFICYKCVEAYPWIKRYANTPGFLAPVFHKAANSAEQSLDPESSMEESNSNKRKANEDGSDDVHESKKLKAEVAVTSLAEYAQQPNQSKVKSEQEQPASLNQSAVQSGSDTICKLDKLPNTTGIFSLFGIESFRDQFCRCAKCYPQLSAHQQLLEEEETYEPPVSEQGSEHGGSTQGSGSLYERGESALRNVDRVRAIEGVMAYNQLKDKLKPFFQQFADSGQAISAEDIKGYFAKMRGDAEAIKEAGDSAKSDHRKEQSGY
ncbi:putative zinc finger in N-recognin-domain-containing protein [Coniella lustricola]|uniref:Putative zinc finger in N-recognin-domain-containing protein n=1 Tax=Coniella lustricola TaxID=2025994 RepID=A0A2T3AH78_9PEZI|nr:putative zinc finger in N-recognin-domain-containing protein [Coniella lustricola]